MGARRGRRGSRIRDSRAGPPVRHDSGEKFRETDRCLGEIGAAPRLQTRVLACRGARRQCGFRVLRPAATVGRGWGHGTVAISTPRSLGTRVCLFPGYPGPVIGPYFRDFPGPKVYLCLPIPPPGEGGGSRTNSEIRVENSEISESRKKFPEKKISARFRRRRRKFLRIQLGISRNPCQKHGGFLFIPSCILKKFACGGEISYFQVVLLISEFL